MNVSDIINDIVILLCGVGLIVVVVYLAKMLRSIDKVSKTMLAMQNIQHEETCTACHNVVKKSYIFCIHCGEQQYKRCQFCKTYMENEARYCPKCKSRMWLNGEEKKIV